MFTVVFFTRLRLVRPIPAVVLSVTLPPKRYTLVGPLTQELRTVTREASILSKEH